MSTTSVIWRQLGVALAAVVIHTRGVAQQPAAPNSPQSTAIQLSAYRSPALALVQPAAGGTVPEDKPVVVFRFAAGEPNDPIDVRSFAVAVDGQDRTNLFQLSGGEAWGPLSQADGVPSLEPGSHQIAARICSSRGTCADLAATVLVVPSALNRGEPPPPNATRRRKLLGAVLDALKKILVP